MSTHQPVQPISRSFLGGALVSMAECFKTSATQGFSVRGEHIIDCNSLNSVGHESGGDTWLSQDVHMSQSEVYLVCAAQHLPTQVESLKMFFRANVNCKMAQNWRHVDR